MRGHRLWIEPSGSSICAFCAHRLAVSRPATQARRRLLHTSRSVSRPPATAEARQLDEDDNGRGYESEAVPQRNVSLSGAGPARWGRPSFGNTTIVSTSTNSTGSVLPVFGSGRIELTPEEECARDALRQKVEETERVQAHALRRPVFINRGPGPLSNRAGRPIPYSGTEITDGTKLANTQRQRVGRDVEFPTPRRIDDQDRGSLSLDESSARHSIASQSISLFRLSGHANAVEEPAAWGQLKRRTVASEPVPVSFVEESFKNLNAAEPTASRRYTSLNNRSVLRPRPQTEFEIQSERRPQLRQDRAWDRSMNDSRHRMSDVEPGGRRDIGKTAHSSTFDFPVRRVQSEGEVDTRERITWRPNKADAQSRTEISERTQSEPKYQPEQRFRQPIESSQQGRSRSPRIQDVPKGRDRDKARRREQFTADPQGEDQQAQNAKAELKRQRKLEKARLKAAAATPILLPEFISVSNLAAALRVRWSDFVEKMEELGFEDTSSDYILNSENAGLIAMEYNFEPVIDRRESEDLKARPLPDDISSCPPRPPVVTIMGHVDHGKTTILDYLRKSSIAASEHGGITQHIGAFSVTMPSGKIITFLDTPGHAAFLSMRQRGANVTDIVVLVVAADDSVKPQTIEAINHAKAAKVPIIVAINKIDKEEANVDRVKQDLARNGVDVEDYGGDTQIVCVSGKTGRGMEDLEEAVITLSEIIDMRAEVDGPAEGWVLEASIKSMGKVATVLVRRGTIRPGDFLVAGKTWSRVRVLRNEAGVEIDQATPGTPVQVDGWKVQPLAGDEVLQASTESIAKCAVEYRLEREQRDKLAEDMDVINEDRKIVQVKREREKQEAELAKLAGPDGDVVETKVEEEVNGPKKINFIVKGDVSGSVEAVVDSISAIGNPEVQVQVLRHGVGQLSEFDVEHAGAAKGYLINFNTAVDANISSLAAAAKVDILDHNIIYRLVDDVRAKLSEYLPPLITYKVLGEADVAQIFDITIKGRKQKPIAGCKVRNGTVSKAAKVRIMRNGEKIYEGSLESLKNVKKDVDEMRKGSDCGMGFENFTEFKVGDQVQSYETKEEKRYL